MVNAQVRIGRVWPTRAQQIVEGSALHATQQKKQQKLFNSPPLGSKQGETPNGKFLPIQWDQTNKPKGKTKRKDRTAIQKNGQHLRMFLKKDRKNSHQR